MLALINFAVETVEAQCGIEPARLLARQSAVVYFFDFVLLHALAVQFRHGVVHLSALTHVAV